MDTASPGREHAGASSINILLGLWLMIAPFVLNYANLGVGQTNDIMVGMIVAVVAAIRSYSEVGQPGWNWINICAGIWLVFAPFVLGYSSNATPLWNDIVLGTIITILAWTSATVTNRTLPPGSPAP